MFVRIKAVGTNACGDGAYLCHRELAGNLGTFRLDKEADAKHHTLGQGLPRNTGPCQGPWPESKWVTRTCG